MANPTARRFVLLQLLMFWQGGFLFYALIVVPIGSDVTVSITQGFVTRRVADWLNAAGLITLVLLLAEAATSATLRRTRLALLITAMIVQLALIGLHVLMDRHLEPKLQMINDAKAFYSLHVYYLILSGVLWFVMLAAVWLMLHAWQAEDRAATTNEEPAAS